jgi:predicted lipid-binding transport protein (Tim44 family)
MRTAILAVLLAFAAMPGIRAQEADADVKSKIIALERLSKMQAYPAKDVKTLDRLLDRDFLSVNLEGRLETKADLLLFVQSADSLQYQIDEMVVRVHEETAVVTGLYQLKGWVHGLPILQRGRFVDTWLLKDGQWAAIASLSTPAK